MKKNNFNFLIQKFIPILGDVSLENYEDRSRRGNLSVFWGFLTLFTLFTGLSYLLYGFFELVLSSLAITIISALNLWHIKQNKNIRISQWCAVALLIPVNWYTLYLSQTTNVSPIILLLYPPVFMFGLGIRLGILYCSILFFSTVVALFFGLPGNSPPETTPYTNVNKARLIGVLGSSIFFSWLAETLRTHMQHRLIETGKRIEKYALQDPLTGLGNRRSFERRLEQEKARAHREKINLALCICDIDRFKKFNDTYGHDCGDAALKHVVTVTQSTLRKEDSFFRWGGEEFTILLPTLHAEEAGCILERIRETIETTPLVYEGKELYITLSFGAFLYDFLLSDEQNFDIADSRLYQAKRNGRNCVVWQ